MKQLSDCTDILIVAPFVLGYLWAADKFCVKILGASKKGERLFLILSFCSWLFSSILSRLYSSLYIFSVLLGPVFFMGLVVLLFQSDREKRILAAAILMVAVRTVTDFCDSFLSCLALFFLHTVKKIPEPVFKDWEIGLSAGVSYCFAILAVYWMSKHLAPVFGGKRRKWYLILAVPLLVIIAMYDVASLGANYGVMVRSGGNMGVYYDQLFSFIEFLVLDLLSMAATGFYVFGMNRIYLEQEKSGQYHSQIAVYKMLAEQYRQSERLRHDMKNHIIALSALSRNKEWEKIDDYLKNMEDIALDAGGDMTGNKAVDALLYQKRKRAQEENIKWECDVQMPKECSINEFDLCVLFGNLLDNALEACGRMQCGECRFINIQAKTVKKCLLLEVKNSMNGAEKYTDGSTNKGDSLEHGIGLLNVGDVVNKYNGVVNKEAEKGIFVISILIPLHDAAHDIKAAV
ncbi:MAG: GHKL domain-containing protein [Lachnospiraceae bacterium]|nr:GHKL domain-containing protein [Lachnospiraceae bacterium]